MSSNDSSTGRTIRTRRRAPVPREVRQSAEVRADRKPCRAHEADRRDRAGRVAPAPAPRALTPPRSRDPTPRSKRSSGRRRDSHTDAGRAARAAVLFSSSRCRAETASPSSRMPAVSGSSALTRARPQGCRPALAPATVEALAARRPGRGESATPSTCSARRPRRTYEAALPACSRIRARRGDRAVRAAGGRERPPTSPRRSRARRPAPKAGPAGRDQRRPRPGRELHLPRVGSEGAGLAARRAAWLRRPAAEPPLSTASTGGRRRDRGPGSRGLDDAWLEPADLRALLGAYGLPLVGERRRRTPRRQLQPHASRVSRRRQDRRREHTRPRPAGSTWTCATRSCAARMRGGRRPSARTAVRQRRRRAARGCDPGSRVRASRRVRPRWGVRRVDRVDEVRARAAPARSTSRSWFRAARRRSSSTAGAARRRPTVMQSPT